jgi:hypothetical protein
MGNRAQDLLLANQGRRLQSGWKNNHARRSGQHWKKALKGVVKEKLLKVQDTKREYHKQETADQNKKVAGQSTPWSVHKRH